MLGDINEEWRVQIRLVIEEPTEEPEGRLVFVPRHEGDEHWYEFSGEGSRTKFFGGMEPLSNAMASPPGFENLWTIPVVGTTRDLTAA